MDSTLRNDTTPPFIKVKRYIYRFPFPWTVAPASLRTHGILSEHTICRFHVEFVHVIEVQRWASQNVEADAVDALWH